MIQAGDFGVLYYFEHIDKNVNPEIYDPVSYEQWKMLRELEPTKFRNGYDFYVTSKKEQFDSEVERRKSCSLEIKTVHFDLTYQNLKGTQKTLTKIQENILFDKWSDKELVNKILKR
tara:strand:- start:6155 stop:6505 length:351 start_codon:yes stop_codon:yes gene_type:complete